MPSRKRTHDEADAEPAQAMQTSLAEPSLLARIRNMWQFANLVQWIYIFGDTVKIDDSLDIETLETECLRPGAPFLKDLGLRLLQFLSSHRGLNLNLFDEYTRRQYLSKAPHLNPFGDGEVAASFNDFDVSTKIKILQQLTIFAMMYSDKLREKSDETDQTQWRIEPYGWDSDDRTYFVLDDNRLYRQTDAPPPQPPKPTTKASKKTKAGRASLRASKRRRTAAGPQDDDATAHKDDATAHKDDATARKDDATARKDDDAGGHGQEDREPEDNGLGGMKWECIAVGLDQLREFLGTLLKTRDENEKILRDVLEQNLVPILEKQETLMKRKAQARERELASMAKMANAKRSSRIAGRLEQQKAQEQAREEERRRITEQVAAKKEADRQLRLEKERQERMRSRGDRLQERQTRRMRQLTRLSEDGGDGRSDSEARRAQSEIARKKQSLEEDDADWIFDCVCGVYGQVDDGSHSIACERCNVWQHSACLQVSQEEAESPDFNFVCSACRHREEAGAKPRTTIKLKIGNNQDHDHDQDHDQDQDDHDHHNHHHNHERRRGSRGGSGGSSRSSRSSSSSSSIDPAKADDGGRDCSQATTRSSRDPFTKNATLLPPPPASEQSDQPVIPVKRPGRSSFGKLPRPVFGDGSNVQTPCSRPTAANPLSSSPPMRLTPAGGPGPLLTRSQSPALATTPSVAGKGGGGHADARGFPPSTPIMGGGSPDGSFTMATLPPSEHGISPTKHSPPPRPHSSHGSANGGSFSSIIPPTTTLVPSPPPQIMTPPHKQASGTVRR